MFLQNYYTIYDLGSKRVGFFRHSLSNTKVGDDGIERDVKPDDPFIPIPIPVYDAETGSGITFPLWAIIVTVVSVVAVLMVGVFLIMKRRQTAKKSTFGNDYQSLNYNWTINSGKE